MIQEYRESCVTRCACEFCVCGEKASGKSSFNLTPGRMLLLVA
jgi:hypothetical protein